MANITELIRNYLRENRRLVIPGVGAFIVKESGEIIFSELLKEDDGRLHEILSREGLAEMEIAVTIDRFIFELQHETKTYGFYRMSGIGTLRLDPATKTLRLIEEPKSTPIVAEEPAVKPAETPKQESDRAPAVEAEPTTEEPTAEPTTEEPTAEPTTEEPTAEPTIEEPTAEPTIEAPQPKAEPKPIELPQPKVQPAPQKAEVRAEDTTHNAPAPKQRTQQRTRYKIDLIILACVVLVTLIALGVMGYGWYKSYHKAEPNDTEQMNALRDDNFRPHTDEAERQ